MKVFWGYRGMLFNFLQRLVKIAKRLVTITKFDFYGPSPQPLPSVSRVHLNFQVAMSDVENEENRYSLFAELLESSHQEVEFQHLVLLLQAWPPMSHEYV